MDRVHSMHPPPPVARRMHHVAAVPAVAVHAAPRIPIPLAAELRAPPLHEHAHRWRRRLVTFLSAIHAFLSALCKDICVVGSASTASGSGNGMSAGASSIPPEVQRRIDALEDEVPSLAP